MTTDALQIYTNIQPLDKVENDPNLYSYLSSLRPPMFGTNRNNNFYDGKNVNAAWVIQRSYRMHRAKRTTARMRYEMWQRNADEQWSLYAQLADYNCITTQAWNLTNVFKLRSKKRLEYSEMRHTALPLRIVNTQVIAGEKREVLGEAAIKYRDRTKFMEKQSVRNKAFFATGQY